MISYSWDYTLFDLSSKMVDPLCIAWSYLRFRMIAPLDPNQFDNFSSKTKEISFRAFIALSSVAVCLAAPLSLLCSIVILAGGSKLLRAFGNALQKEGITHVRGIAPEKKLEDLQVKIMNWNICGAAGGLSLNHGGVLHWNRRLDGMIKKIREEDPDVLILEEIYDTALGIQLMKHLSCDYAHFFTHLGPNLWGSEGGIMVISKCAVHRFAFESFTTNHWTLNRGFATIELKKSTQSSQPFIRILGTHFIHGNSSKDRENRSQQFAQILNSVTGESLPTILAGDLNMSRESQEGEFLALHLVHGYLGNELTCTNRLVAQWDQESKSVWGEIIDYISLFKKSLPAVLENGHLIKAFDETYNTKTALSDHHAVAVTVKILYTAAGSKT